MFSRFLTLFDLDDWTQARAEQNPAPQSPSGYSDNIWDPDSPPPQHAQLPTHQSDERTSSREELAQQDTAEDSSHRATSDESVLGLQHPRHGEATSLPSEQAHHRILGDPSATRPSDNAEDVDMHPREEQIETRQSQDQTHSKHAQHAQHDTVETPAIIRESASPHNLEDIPLSPVPSAQTPARHTENPSQRLDLAQQHAPETPAVMRPSGPSDNAEDIPLPPTPPEQPETRRRQDHLPRPELHQHDTLKAPAIMRDSAPSHNAEAISLPPTPPEQTLARPSAEETAPRPDPHDTVEDPSVKHQSEDQPLRSEHLQLDTTDEPPAPHHSATSATDEQAEQPPSRQEDSPRSEHLQHATATVFSSREPVEEHSSQQEQPQARPTHAELSQHSDHLNLQQETVDDPAVLRDSLSSDNTEGVPLPSTPPEQTQTSRNEDQPSLPSVQQDRLETPEYISIPLRSDNAEDIEQSPHEEQTDLPSVEEPSNAEEPEEPSPPQGFLTESEIALLLSSRPKSAPACYPAWTPLGGAPQSVSLAPEHLLIRPASVPLKLQDQDYVFYEGYEDSISSGTPDESTTAAAAQGDPQANATAGMPAQSSEDEQEMDEAMNQQRLHQQRLLGLLQGTVVIADEVEAAAGASAARVESVESWESPHLETIPEVPEPSSPDEEAIVTVQAVEVEDSSESASQAAIKTISDASGPSVLQDVIETAQAVEVDDSHLETIVEVPEPSSPQQHSTAIVDSTKAQPLHEKCDGAVQRTEASAAPVPETVEARLNIEDDSAQKLEGERDTESASSAATVHAHPVVAETAKSAETQISLEAQISPETAAETVQPVPVETLHVEATATDPPSQSESMVAVKLVQPPHTAAPSEASKVHGTAISEDEIGRKPEIMKDADKASSIEALATGPVAGEAAKAAASECAQEASAEAAQVKQGSKSASGSGGAAKAKATKAKATKAKATKAKATTARPLPQPQSIVITELKQLLTRISRCDSEAISLINELLEIHPRLRSRVLDMLSRSLETKEIPTSSSLEIDDTIKARLDSLQKFIALVTSDPPSPEDDGVIKRTIPGFLEWGLFFLPLDPSSSTVSPDRLMQLMRDCVAMFRRISKIPKCGGKIGEMVAAQRLAMRIWFMVKRPSDDIITVNEVDVTILEYVVSTMQEEEVNLESLVQVTGVNVDMLAKRSAARIDAAVSAGDFGSGEILVCGIIGMLLLPSTTCSTSPFHGGGIVGAFTRLFVQSTKVATSPNSIAITSLQLFYLIRHMEDTKGFPWVREAVENGVLEGILEFLLRLKGVKNNDAYASEKMMLHFLVGNLPCYLAYKSVLEVTKKAIESLDWSKVKSAGEEWEAAMESLRKMVEARSVIAGLNPRKYRPYCAKVLSREDTQLEKMHQV
ncbi:hypothetical protein M422DRAFT_51433 [Sphaerobolus stellatus SS14]|uniref:Uncharacterized protein n=1 Tax=Sphaerobolus stellatus (strain SS14) TaxID=990650 RepID=A0A0C9V1I4_SPHS4|nr:hypothetical protein M422DRAFT_51433 [Sphaerobolus stellatus SS14]